jgi:hypothetical protein
MGASTAPLPNSFAAVGVHTVATVSVSGIIAILVYDCIGLVIASGSSRPRDCAQPSTRGRMPRTSHLAITRAKSSAGAAAIGSTLQLLLTSGAA